MQVIHSISQWRTVRQSISNTSSIGFVPTMGNLHQGHASLFQKSARENTVTVASLFVNPTQFNQADDFIHYPRTLEADLHILRESGVDYCLLPDEKTMYADDYRFQIQEKVETQHLEGKQRPGHFTGVLTVVMKLLQLVKPDSAYFGEKDYQQYQLIRDMAATFFIDVDIKSCATIREPSMLAYSSRNRRLTPQEFEQANRFAQIFHNTNSCEAIIAKLKEIDIDVEYVEEYENRRYAAIKIGDVRLIDNYALS